MSVYLIRHPGDNAVKIGFTDGDPLDRLRSMQTGSASVLEMVAIIHDAPRAVERDLHRKFRSLQVRPNGEWFVDAHEIREAFKNHSAENHRVHLRSRMDDAMTLLKEGMEIADATTGQMETVLRNTQAVLAEMVCDCAAPHADLDEYTIASDPIRSFWEEFRDRFVWDLLPFTFLYDLYKVWFIQVSPSGSPVPRQRFVADLVVVVRSDAEFHLANKNKKIRPSAMLDAPEHLIAEYELKAWYSPSYSGSDLDRLCKPELIQNYRGILRIPTSTTTEEEASPRWPSTVTTSKTASPTALAHAGGESTP